MAGLDGPALRMLAAASIRHADEEVPELLGIRPRDLGLAYHPKAVHQPSGPDSPPWQRKS